MASLSLSFCVGTCVMFFCLTLLLASSVSPVLGVTVNSTQNVYGMCTGPDQLGFRRYEDGQSIDCGGSLKDGTLVDSFLVRPNIPFYFIWCREAYWGFTRQPGNSSSITSLGLSPLDNNDDDTLMNVNDGGNIKNIKSYCGHTPGGVSETVANNSWTVANPTEFSNECCILTWTPPTNYSNDIYLQAAFGHTSYARLVTDAAFIPAPPKNTTAPTNSSSASSSSSSSSSSTGTSNTNTGSNSTSSSFSFTNSSSSSFSSSSSSSSSSSTGVTSPPSSTAQPVPGGASSSTNPTQAFVIAIVMIVCATFAQ